MSLGESAKPKSSERPAMTQLISSMQRAISVDLIVSEADSSQVFSTLWASSIIT